MGSGLYEKTYYKSDGSGDVKGKTIYRCTTSGLALKNINPGEFDFSFLTDDSEGGVLGNVKLILETLESYNSNTNSYDVDGANNYSQAYEELKTDVQNIEGQLEALKALLEGQVSAIESEIKADHAWAYSASYEDASWGDRS